MAVTAHSFHTCPLRTSSLLIVHQDDQTILTATDEVFDVLGYTPSDLIGRSILALGIRQQHDSFHYLARHATGLAVPLEICIHRDPLGSTPRLDYWLIKPESLTPSSSVAVFQLSPYGTVEHVHLSMDSFSQNPSELLGRPIMAFVHPDDVQKLCANVSQTATRKKRAIRTVRLRWMIENNSSDADKSIWISLTVVTMADGGRPICIMRTLGDKGDQSCRFPFNILAATAALPMNTIRFLLYGTVEAMREAFAQAKTYLIEFLTHILTSLVDLVADCVEPNRQGWYIENGSPATESIQVQNGESIQTLNIINGVPKDWRTTARMLVHETGVYPWARWSLDVLQTAGLIEPKQASELLARIG
ncbi:hypothetical protein DFQ28_003442 [Apophysomyces sp. BC1034]|nr:hypothetical protein DFQ30_001452 [Apophysomyces sp. BC1015]KAG0182963.1 hypothetical protein DFQ29_001107 [Apophysomyces sp. BC1021]KAG0193771.1 hypothetical protein DFQ28_003442 [Apophysomyces sp. BC1034]